LIKPIGPNRIECKAGGETFAARSLDHFAGQNEAVSLTIGVNSKTSNTSVSRTFVINTKSKKTAMPITPATSSPTKTMNWIRFTFISLSSILRARQLYEKVEIAVRFG